MAKKGSYIPKAGDLVLLPAHAASFTVIEVNVEKKTVNVEAVAGSIRMLADVPWRLLSQLNATEHAARMKRLGQKENVRYLTPRRKR